MGKDIKSPSLVAPKDLKTAHDLYVEKVNRQRAKERMLADRKRAEAAEAEWIDQLLTSYDVFRIEFDPTSPDDPYQFAPILITDSTCEVKDSDEKLNSVKFTWRYADNRPYLRLSASPGIFTSPYNPTFS